jgi:hypothetical protein
MNKTTEVEKWGKFVETEKYGLALIILNQEDGSDNHAVWVIARYDEVKRIEFNVPFEVRAEAKSFLEKVDSEEIQCRLDNEIEWQKGQN